MACIAGRISELAVDTGAGYDALDKLVDCNLQMNFEELECTSHDTTTSREYIPHFSDATAEGSCRYDNASVTQAYVRDQALAKGTYPVRFRLDTGSGEEEYTATGFALSINLETPLDDVASMSFTIRMSGMTKATQ